MNSKLSRKNTEQPVIFGLTFFGWHQLRTIRLFGSESHSCWRKLRPKSSRSSAAATQAFCVTVNKYVSQSHVTAEVNHLDFPIHT